MKKFRFFFFLFSSHASTVFPCCRCWVKWRRREKKIETTFTLRNTMSSIFMFLSFLLLSYLSAFRQVKLLHGRSFEEMNKVGKSSRVFSTFHLNFSFPQLNPCLPHYCTPKAKSKLHSTRLSLLSLFCHHFALPHIQRVV